MRSWIRVLTMLEYGMVMVKHISVILNLVYNVSFKLYQITDITKITQEEIKTELKSRGEEQPARKNSY